MASRPGRVSSRDELLRKVWVILVARNLERVADLATNVAEEVVFIAGARIIKHHADEAPTGGRPGIARSDFGRT